MKIGAALSGGGIRCVAHLGMLEALEEHGINVNELSGTSAGALCGALYCYGYRPREILEIVQGINFLRVIRPALNWKGLLRIENATATLRDYIREDNFKALKKPLTVAATNLRTGQVKYFDQGPLLKPVLASCSIPVVFDPVMIDHEPFVDGGLLDNMPVNALRQSDFVVGMHCNPINHDYSASNWRDLMERSLLLAISSATNVQKGSCDLFWEPQAVGKYKVFDFRKAEDIFNIGYEFAQAQLEEPETKEMLSAA